MSLPLCKLFGHAYCPRLSVQSRSLSFSAWPRKNKLWLTLGTFAGSIGAFLFTLDRAVRASELEIDGPRLDWYHWKYFNSIDHASARRGFEVYKNVCSACHSLKYLAFRDLVGGTHTEQEARTIAEEYQIKDGPDEEGNMFERPGRLSDYMPSPYPNMEAARAANNGAFPPDLTYITSAKPGFENYVFHLLTGYVEDTPAGISLREGQHFNPYFMGGAISMAPPLYDDVIEYEDGTPAYRSQLAKDVITFLTWASEPEYDNRRLMLVRFSLVSPILAAVIYFYKCHKFSTIKSRKFMKWPKKVKDELKKK